MKIITLTVVFLTILCACSQKITTYDAKIENKRVTLDGIAYDVDLVHETTNTYLDGQLVKQVVTSIHSETSIEYTYKGGLKASKKVKSPVRDDLIIYGYDEQDRLIEEVYEREGVIAPRMAYVYEGKNMKTFYYDIKGDILFVREAVLDARGNIVRAKNYNAEGEVISSFQAIYDKDLRIKSITHKPKGKVDKRYYAYNNLGDLVFTYFVFVDDDTVFLSDFYDYVYNEENQAIHVKVRRVQSSIEPKQARPYWDDMELE